MIHSIKIALFSILLLLFSACDDSTFTEVVAEESFSFGGVVVDGYISGAAVCLDLDSDGVCSTEEPTTQSDENGTFSFNSSEFSGYTFIPIIARGGVDTATDKYFMGELKAIINTYDLVQDSSIIVNPLTDLVAISFLRAPTRDGLALQESIYEVAEVFSLDQEDVLEDPMQNVVLFAKVQQVQHLKALIETAATKTYVENGDKSLPQEIREALVTQIKESVDGELKLDRVLETIDIELDILIPEYEKIFIIDQMNIINTSLDLLIADASIDVDNLDRLQLALENELEEAYVLLESADENTTIEAVDIDISYTYITESIFDKSGAIVDEQACLETNGYMMISDSSLTESRQSDDDNGVSITSSYDFNYDVYATEVQLYYTELTSQKVYENTILFTDNEYFDRDSYIFVFDQARVQNDNKTVYIRTPLDEDGLFGCYRAILDTTVANDIALTKVFRYTDI